MKKGFVMYFENLREIRDLPDWQYAAVMRALGEYAERLAEGREAEACLEAEKAKLPRNAARILEFMAGGARRDHEKYVDTTERRTRYREEHKARSAAPAQSAASARGKDDAWRYVNKSNA